MRIILAFTALVIAIQANSESLDGRLAKMRAVIQKDGRCEFAVVAIPKDKTDTKFFPRAAVCIGDIVVDQGTMKEKSGCAAFYLNVYELYTQPLVPAYGFNIAEGKKCSSGGFETVMNDLLLTDNTGDKPRRVPVKSAFFYPYKLNGDEMKILIDGQSKFRHWYDKERTAYAAEEDARERSPRAKAGAVKKAQEAQEHATQIKEDDAKKEREKLWN